MTTLENPTRTRRATVLKTKVQLYRRKIVHGRYSAPVPCVPMWFRTKEEAMRVAKEWVENGRVM